MLLEYAVNNPALGAFLAGLIKTYYETETVQACDAFVNTNLSVSGGYSFYSPAVFPYPRWYAWSQGDFGLISLGGTENGQSGARWFSDYFPQLSPTLWPSVNVVADRFYDNFRRVPQLNAALTKKILVVSGHSQGGVIGLALLRVRGRTPEDGDTYCISFGAPKVGKQEFLDSVNWVSKIRWMCDADPVPLVPFLPNVTIPTTIPLTPADVFGLQYYVHSEGGISIDAGGNTTPAVTPPNVSLFPILDVGTWLFSMMFGANSPHKIDNYVNRLNENVRNTPPNPGGGGEWGQQEIVEPSRRRDISRTLEPTIQALRFQSTYQNSIAYDTPDNVIFRKVKSNGVWYCAFGDRFISAGPTRRKAGLMAQAGNLFLRRLQREGLVDPDAVVNQFAAFLAAAQDPSSGIRPQILTSVH